MALEPGSDADESNWLHEAAQAHPEPGPQAVRVLYGVATRLVERLADATGKDPMRC